MNRVMEKQAMVLMCLVFLIVFSKEYDNIIIPILIGIIVSEIGIIISETDTASLRGKRLAAIGLVFCGLFFICKPVAFFAPVVVYIAVELELYLGFAGLVLGAATLYMYLGLEATAVCLVSSFIAGITANASRCARQYKADYLKITDSSVELEKNLRFKNKELLENQDASIHVATLQERNRIAREIHDNVGHMLSRTILQIGALMTIYKDEPLHGQLESISGSLNDAMNNIRESVHDLHNDSVDFKAALENVTAQMREKYIFKLDFDMSEDVPANVKYCFIAIVKEAMTNIIKHSDATRVSVLVREHPGMYQMVIEDNGSGADTWSVPGIGLTNMEDRVRGLAGNIVFSNDNGFKILISVPKNKG